MSTPEFGAPTLRRLVAAGYTLAAVVCQPDRPAGRGLQLAAPAVKQVALELGLENCYVQELGSTHILLPDFRRRRPFAR